MAIADADLVRLRTRPQKQQLYMAVDVPELIWACEINGDQGRGDTSIPFKNETTVVEPEMHYLAWAGSISGDNSIGVTRFKSKAGSTLEIASNDMELSDGDFISVYQVIHPMSILPSISGVYEDEDKAYVDENTLQHPLGRIGPPGAGHLDENGELTVRFIEDSVAIASGAAVATHAWIFTDGTPSITAGSGPLPIVYNSTGRKWVKYTVFDTNGKTHTRYSQVHVFNTTTAPAISAFEMTSLSGDKDSGGWRATITVKQDADETDFPDMAQVVIFTDQWWGTENINIGDDWTYRENILYVGYILHDTVYKDPETGWVTFETASIVEIMKELTAWGASFKEDSSLAWHNIPNMTLNLEAFHVFTEHSTIDHIADVYLNLEYIDMVYTDLTEGKMYDHIKTGIGEAGRALLLNNKLGQIYLEPNYQLSLPADQAGLETMFSMGHDDWRDQLTLGAEDYVKKTCQVDFIGFYYDGRDPKSLGALAPGRQYPSGSVQKVTGVRIDTQTDANNYAGVFAGYFNNEFNNIVIPMAGFWPVFDIAPQKYVQLTLTAADTKRGLVWTNQDISPKAITFQYNYEWGFCLTDVVAEKKSVPDGAITNEIPEVVEPSPPSPTPPPGPPAINPSDWGVIIYDQYRIGRSLDFFSSFEDIHWSEVTPEDIDPDTDEIYRVSVDSSNGESLMGCSLGLFHTSNIGAGTVSWRKILDAADVLEVTGIDGDFGSVIMKNGKWVAAWLGSKNAGKTSVYYTGTGAIVDEPRYLGPSVMAQLAIKPSQLLGLGSRNAYCTAYLDSKYMLGLTRRSQKALLLWDAFASEADLLYNYSMFSEPFSVTPPQSDPSSEWAICGMTSSYVIAWTGKIFNRAIYNSWIWNGGGTVPVYEDNTAIFGMDEIGGSLLYWKNDDLYRDTTKIAETGTILGGVGQRAGRAVYSRNNGSDEIIVANSTVAGEDEAIVVWTSTGFTGSPTHYDKSGNYETAVAGWSGAAGSGGARGNVGIELYKVYT